MKFNGKKFFNNAGKNIKQQLTYDGFIEDYKKAKKLLEDACYEKMIDYIYNVELLCLAERMLLKEKQIKSDKRINKILGWFKIK